MLFGVALFTFGVDEFISGVTDVMGDDEFGVACDDVIVTGSGTRLPDLLGSLACCNTVYTLSTLLRFSRNGIKSNSSRSFMSSNQDATGTWKRREAAH